MSKFLPAAPYVLIRLDEKMETRHGLSLSDIQNPQAHLPTRGEVLAVFSGKGYASSRHLLEQRSCACVGGFGMDVQSWSMPWDVPVEVVPGDMVLMSYHHNIQNEENKNKQVGDGVLVHYQNLYAVERGEGLYPLNGLVFFDGMGQVDVWGQPREAGSRERPGGGIVIAEGCLVKEYQDGDVLRDTRKVGIGTEIRVKTGFGVPIEHGHYRKHGKSDIWRVHRRWIAATKIA